MLTNEQRKQLWIESMQELSRNHEPMSLNKHEYYDIFAIVDNNFDEILDLLRSKITSKAQVALEERVWLRAIARVVDERQKTEAKENPPPKFVIVNPKAVG